MFNIQLTDKQAYAIHTQLIRACTYAYNDGTQKDEAEANESLVNFETACKEAGYDPNHLEA